MLIPFATDRPLHRPPLVTPLLIGFNIAVYLCQVMLERTSGSPDAYQKLLTPFLLDGANFHFWTLVSYAFLHGSWLHLLGNMVFLWVFGPNVEDRFTRWGFLAFYLVGAIAAGGAHAFFETNPALGASGAIAAVTGAYIVLFPRTNVRVILFLIIIGIFNIPAWIFIVLAIARDLVFVGFSDDNVARLAHLGGYAFGILVGLFLLWRRILSREPYDLFTIGRQAYRRRQMREAAYQARQDLARSAVRRASGEVNVDESAVAQARAAVATMLAQNDLEGAGAAYKRLVERHAGTASVCTLSRRHQLDLANHFFSTGDHDGAAYAYSRFLEVYGKDSETPRVRLILGLINARYLNDPIAARQLLSGLEIQLADDAQKQLAQTLLKELG